MRITRLTAVIVRLPLRRSIRHASAQRVESTNVLVRCQLADGTEGWGEGVPRPYVTDETPEGALAQLAATRLDPLGADCVGWDDVIAMLDTFRPASLGPDPRGCRGNALRCAVELSVLDAFGRWLCEPVRAVTARYAPAAPIRQPSERVRYSGAIMSEGPWAERVSALKMRAWGFAHCKVKVGMPGADDARRLATIRRWIGPGVDLRVDANEAWHADEVVRRIEPLAALGVSCVEQPVRHAQVHCLADLRRQIAVPLMLDESLTSVADAQAAIEQETCDLLNIRLSKCGGFLQSLRLAAMAHQSGLGYQLGCHPGESGILSAAGRHWATSVAGIRWLEGSYDRYLFRRRLTQEDMTFDYGGWADALSTPGLGVTVHPEVIRHWIIRQEVFTIG